MQAGMPKKSEKNMLLERAKASLQQSNYAAAAVFFKRALEMTPEAPDLLRHYGRALAALDRRHEALAALKQAVALMPDDYNTHAFYAGALRDFCQFDEALEEYEAAYKLNPDYVDALWARADILLTQGRFIEGWENYEIRWKLGPHYPFTRLARLEAGYTTRRWTGEDLTGKTIKIYMEQGFGDTIFGSRYIPLVKARGARIIVMCHPDLHRLFKTIPGVDRLVGLEKIDETIDYHVPIMSLPGLFATDASSIPPPPALKVTEPLPAEAAALLRLGKDRFKVGIVWTGSPTYGANHKRAVPFSRFLPLAEVPGVQLYSLQKGEAEKELVVMGAQGPVLELGPYLKDFADTAAVLKQLGLVIMTDSSVAHLAGSTGCPVWNLLAYRAYWVYHTGETTPWYPSMRLFRQPQPGDWDSVFARVKRELALKARR